MATTRPPRVPNDQAPTATPAAAPAPLPAPVPVPAPVVVTTPPAPRRAPRGNTGQGNGNRPPPNDGHGNGPNHRQRDYFPWILGIVVSLTLLCLFMALYVSRDDKASDNTNKLFNALVDIFKVGCGAVIGLLGGRRA